MVRRFPDLFGHSECGRTTELSRMLRLHLWTYRACWGGALLFKAMAGILILANLDEFAKIRKNRGRHWLAVGIGYDAVKTRGFRLTPVAIDFSDP